MKNLQARKALDKIVLNWTEERWTHNDECQFRSSWTNPCGCNNELDQQDLTLIRYALEEYSVARQWDRTHKQEIKQVLNKVKEITRK